MRTLSLLLASIAFIALPVAAASATLTIPLSEQNGSGESGTATLTDGIAGVTVVISLKGAPATAQPAHIHSGTCSSLGGVVYPLKDVVGGSSNTTVPKITIASLTGSKAFAINVHESAAHLEKYVACGNITAKSSM